MSGPVSEVKLNIDTKSVTNDVEEEDIEEEEDEQDNITIDIDQEINCANEMSENNELTSKFQSIVFSKNSVDMHYQPSTLNNNEFEANKINRYSAKSITPNQDYEYKESKSPISPSTSKLNKNPSTNRLANVFISTDRSYNINKNASSRQANDNKTILTKVRRKVYIDR